MRITLEKSKIVTIFVGNRLVGAISENGVLHHNSTHPLLKKNSYKYQIPVRISINTTHLYLSGLLC